MSDPSLNNTLFNLPIDQAVTSDMMLGLKPGAPRSRSYRISQAPLNASTFAPGSQCSVELPTGRKGTWLDQSQSYLKFSVQMTSTAACAYTVATGIYLDNSAYSFIQRVDIYNSSNLLESINEYGQLANFLIDTSLTMSDKIGLSQIIGFNNSTVNMLMPAAYAQYGTVLPVQQPGDRSGQSISSIINTSAISTALPYVFTLPFLSGVIGVNSSKMLPVGKLSNPIHIDIYWAANDDAIYYGLAAAGTVWQICNVEFIACYVELTDDISEMMPGAIEYISSHTFKQTSTYLPASTSGEFTTMIPFRCHSLNAIYARFRNQSTAIQGAATAAYRKSSSVNPNISSYYFRIGSSVYPNKNVILMNGNNIGTGGEGYAELLKSFHALATNIGNSAIQNTQYNVCAGNTVGGVAAPIQGWNTAFVPGRKDQGIQDTHNNAFCIGLELQSFANRNDIILSGVSTLNAQMFFTAIIYNGLTSGGFPAYNYTVDFFANMDMILIIQDGIMSSKC
jgi:hypothetical protein